LVERQLRKDAQAADQALAQEIALQTGLQFSDDEAALTALGQRIAQSRTQTTIVETLRTFQAARAEVENVYWLDPLGGMNASWPPLGVVAEFSPPDVIQQARLVATPVFEVGIVSIPAATSVNPGVIMAQAVHATDGRFVGIVAASLSLKDLSDPLSVVVQAQQKQGHHLLISIIDNQGKLVATPYSSHLLYTVLDELPGADSALRGHVTSLLAPSTDGQSWLFSSVPVTSTGWAVVVQRPESEALAVVAQFHLWLLIAALLFALGGLLFWLLLLFNIIRPLHTLAIQHQTLPTSELSIPTSTITLARREDEIGALARSLLRLEHDGLEKLGELRTLLETSNGVVSSLEPYTVVEKIIGEVRRLVDVQAAAVLLPDKQGVLRVMVSAGHSERYNSLLALAPENADSSAVQALREGKPVQKILDASRSASSLSYDEGFRSVLAIPIISRHAGGVVLSVHRTEPHPFNQNEIDLLLTFANYATLAWEHAVLYERSDERLQIVARENERLYQEASREKQKLYELNEFKTTLLAAVGHELRTPLAAIKGHASTLLQEDVTWSPADQRHFLHTISGEADRLAQLVSNLLDLSRQEAGLLFLNLAPVNFQQLVLKVVAQLQRPGAMISSNVPDTLPLVDMDRARIEVVLHNLLANALLYGNGEARIHAEIHMQKLVVSVSDDGFGIDPDDLPHIFERFYRAGSGRKHHSGGTGLGLTICKAFIEAHKGTIWVESNERGTTFSFSLPYVAPAISSSMKEYTLEGEMFA
jgi:signal transduction histidine kinase